MAAPRPLLFLERRSYRLRRVLDAVRLLPLLGALMWMLPMLWPVAGDGDGGGDPVPMSHALLYIFGVWLGLVAVSLLLWLRVRRMTDPRLDGDAAPTAPAVDAATGDP